MSEKLHTNILLYYVPSPLLHRENTSSVILPFTTDQATKPALQRPPKYSQCPLPYIIIHMTTIPDMIHDAPPQDMILWPNPFQETLIGSKKMLYIIILHSSYTVNPSIYYFKGLKKCVKFLAWCPYLPIFYPHFKILCPGFLCMYYSFNRQKTTPLVCNTTIININTMIIFW